MKIVPRHRGEFIDLKTVINYKREKTDDLLITNGLLNGPKEVITKQRD